MLRKLLNSLFKIAFSLLLGGVILYCTYRDFDFESVALSLRREMHMGWMWVSLFFGVASHVARGLRWRLALAPMGETARRSVAIHAIFFSYAVGLLIPRIGEVWRCTVLTRYDGVTFSKSLGTVVMERLIDMITVALITFTVFALWHEQFVAFFGLTHTDWHSVVTRFTPSSFPFLITAIGVAVVLLCWWLIRRTHFRERMQALLRGVWVGLFSLRTMPHKWRYLFYTLAIWVCYFYHFYVAFFCFPFSTNLGLAAGLVLFVVGTIAVIVPTPNGAGSWHFGIITMMAIYGVATDACARFALLVHGFQTLLIVVLGVYAMIALSVTKKRKTTQQNGLKSP